MCIRDRDTVIKIAKITRIIGEWKFRYDLDGEVEMETLSPELLDIATWVRDVYKRQAQELVGFFHALAGLDLDGAEVGFAEGVEVDLFLQLRLDLNGGQELSLIHI